MRRGRQPGSISDDCRFVSQLRFIDALPLRYLAAASFCGYVVLALAFPLLHNFDRQPVGDIRTFLPDLNGGLFYGLLLIILFALHWLMYRRVESGSVSSFRVVAAASLLFAAPLLFIYPINANDVYRYIIRGLLSSRHGLSPFEFAPADAGNELYSLLSGEWSTATSPYGPLWELTASTITSIGQDNLLFNMLLFKLLGTVSLVIVAFLLWQLLPSPSSGIVERNEARRLAFAVLWAWNPALLLTFVGNAHNDALMILVLMGGWLLINRDYHTSGFLIMLAAVLIKPIALLALPVAFITIWKQLHNVRQRTQFFFLSFAGGTMLFFLAFFPFGDPLPLFLRLLEEASAGASFSPAALLILVAREYGWNGSFAVVSRAITVLFGLFVIWVLWRTWRGNRSERSAAALFWGYVIQALNFRIWYATWPFPWLLLDAFNEENRSSYLLHAGMWFLVTSQLSVIIYGYMRVAIFEGSQLNVHAFGVFFTFLLPILLSWITSSQRLSAQTMC